MIAKNLLIWVSSQLGAGLQEYVTRDLRNSMYAHLQRLPLPFFTRTKTGQLLARVLNDTQQTKAVITEAVTRSIQSAAVVLTSVIVLFRISWRLTLLALVVAPAADRPPAAHPARAAPRAPQAVQPVRRHDGRGAGSR